MRALAPEWEAVPAMSTPGADGWKASISHLRGLFEGLTVTIEDVVVSGDRVAVRSVNRGKHGGRADGHPRHRPPGRVPRL